MMMAIEYFDFLGKKLLKNFAIQNTSLTFALQLKNGILKFFIYVTTNQNKITVLRP